ncbi:PREDICTED: uncharacterized protein LOC109581179 [Amphimedon queenslandica]|uniref:RING-type domain-containing protein n=1 Tax=Amphimedon queenslandica TaxID=400682 RepID=A0A1X7V570_AMPQE|nr:PREDICTED: uncharacterized protein LOC109581179 [Amphimedon queenslandica]|eukprot:XP_019850598.1 PREDICTED: uncharacterized protein LOC109581179 [Amphimedon queenslandica]
MNSLLRQQNYIRCDCCEERNATKQYTTGSYCDECSRNLYNPGRQIGTYNQPKRHFPYNTGNRTQCRCCELCYVQQFIKSLRFVCGHTFTFCNNCALRQEYCPVDGQEITGESLAKLQ